MQTIKETMASILSVLMPACSLPTQEGPVNAWRTFRYCLEYFRCFMPVSGSGYDGEPAAEFVRESGRGPD